MEWVWYQDQGEWYAVQVEKPDWSTPMPVFDAYVAVAADREARAR